MRVHELEDLLHDMVHCHPNKSTEQREKLALYLCELEDRIMKLERSLVSTSNAASCLANGILPD